MKGSSKIIVKILMLSLASTALVSCNKNEEKKPDYILSHADMVKALAEVYIAEQKVNRLSLSMDSAIQVFRPMEKKVFENLNIPDSVFRASFDYYMDHPKEMDMIYGVLIDSLQLREQRVPAAPLPAR